MSGLNIYSPVLPPGSPLIIVTLVPDPVTGFNPSGVEGVEFDGAEAILNHSTKSQKRIFGVFIADKDARKLYTAIRDSENSELTGTGVNKLWNGNKSAREIRNLGKLLQDMGLIEISYAPTLGTPTTYYRIKESYEVF